MKLALQHTDNSPYARCGIFIKHASPKVWLEEITRMQLKLSECRLYPCPGTEANSISGVLIIFKTEQKKIDTHANVCVQKVQTGFYIPENTKLNMALTQEEFTKLLQGKPHFFHHQYGLIELISEVQWETIIQVPKEQFPAIETPAKGVNIPMEVTAFSVEIEEKETETTLENPFSGQEVNPEDLPFDMKKVLQGNNKEVDKYLRYLEKNPEAALKMAVPLDMMGTSRGKAFAKYKFKSNFFDKIGFGDVSEGTKTKFKTIVGILAIIAIFWVGYYVVDQHKKQQIEVVRGKTQVRSQNGTELTNEDIVDVNNELDSETLLTETEINDFNNTRRTSNKNRVAEETADNYLTNGFIIFIALVFGFILFGYLITSRKKVRSKSQPQNDNKPSSWMDLPEESEVFSFTDEEASRGSNFYFGGNELSAQSKVLIVFILIALLAYLFYPMLTTPGIGTVFFIMTIFIVIRLLYLLISKNKTILDD
ncbi:hypothetical protein [uncultured Kordia sp.]|uniref:hypothetical protein n=1 Tax=uncultured Kordia sp. TaxID=507699 RepID=UPI00262E9787|nr:hypothetical protein [uncultured Kordia sp.]